MADTPVGLPHGDLGSLLRLDGRVAIVTGAAQRIGREIARTFASQGAAVVVADIQDDVGTRTVAEIQLGGGEAGYTHADVSQRDQIQKMIRFATDRYGRLDILVNNAHWEKRGSVLEVEEEDWDRSFAVLLRAPYLASIELCEIARSGRLDGQRLRTKRSAALQGLAPRSVARGCLV